MNKSLILAEKPSVGKDIARVMDCKKEGNGYFEGNHYVVTWAFGHLVTHADPEVYDKKYQTWRLEDLPMLPPRLNLTVIKKGGKQFQTVKSLLHRQDIQDIIVATDAGREGELVARWILAKANVEKPLKRLWISSVTDQAIKNGFKELKNGSRYFSLFKAAEARAEADWYVGMNATRALTTKYNAQLSCGRVQTPTLAIVAQREKNIQSFKPASFERIIAITDKNFSLTWRDEKSGEDRIFSTDDAESIVKEQQGKSANITQVDKKVKKQFAPLLYDLTQLQREANGRYGYSAKETLSIMQRLYETHKVVTYPRTDSSYISTDILSTLKDRLKACDVHPYSKHVLAINRRGLKINSNVVQNKKVTDHHAIIPTESAPDFQQFSNKERNIYDMVVQRFLQSFYPAAEYEVIAVHATIGSERFMARGNRVLQQGWKALFQTENEDQQELPPLHKGDLIKIASLKTESGKTSPPPPLDEGALLSAMENPAPYMPGADQKLMKQLKVSGGIGTVATRADVIDKLLNSYLLEKKGKTLKVTSKGRQLLELAPEELKSPALTAQWEQKLKNIEQEFLKKEVFIEEMKKYAESIVKEIKLSTKSFKHDNITGTPCPECGKHLLEVNGKRGKMKVCQDRSCGYKKNISKVTNARCPKCKKKMDLHGEGSGKVFVCRCGYKEKEAAFNQRRKQEKNYKATKQDVNKYLKKQSKDDEFTNPALAEALSKLKNK
ncbi:DNA topoisomerase III [Alteribacillus sp. HJP-4]|uniref:DNA topoisomerase III n=1 Tax=Alteribacillus sp. HJP-4 TaxID=2775394 RepID=UPI0035CD0182